MKPFTPEDVVRWNGMVGQRVWKNPKTESKFEPKPFKSGSKFNTVKAVVVHEQTGRPGFSFVEDESVVECFRCSIAPLAVQKIGDGFVANHNHEGIIFRG